MPSAPITNRRTLGDQRTAGGVTANTGDPIALPQQLAYCEMLA